MGDRAPGGSGSGAGTEAVEYSPDPEEDLILLGVMEGEEPVVLLLGFFPAQERMAALALTGEDAPSGTPDALQGELEERYSLTIDAWLSGEPESWQQLVARGWGQQPSPWIRTALAPWMGRR